MAKRREKKIPTPLVEEIVSKVEESLPSAELGEKHCPACMAGQSLEEGEGTHILATLEHPVELPAAFADADTSVTIVERPQKPIKPKSRPMPKEFRGASSYAEKRLPKAIKEKADLLVEVARREAEIQELTRVIQALGGQNPVGVPISSPVYPNASYQPPMAQYASPLPAQQAQAPPPGNGYPVMTPQKPMRAGGAGALDLGFLAND